MLRGRSLGQAIGVVALVCATFGVSTASAQVDYEIMASLQFNFSNPGARSLAMAGALTGAGDDATGAWTNPGGLTNITRPEVGVEFRGFNFETPFVSAGHFTGQPSGRGIDTVDRPRVRHLRGLDAQPVVRFGGRAQVALRVRVLPHRSRQLRDRASPTEGTFFDDPDDGTLSRASSVRDGTLELQDRQLRWLGRLPVDRPVLGRRRRLVLRLRHLRRTPSATALSAPGRPRAASSARRCGPRTTSCRTSSLQRRGRRQRVRGQRRRVDQPERQVPHRRQLSAGAEVRHGLPSRSTSLGDRIRRHAAQFKVPDVIARRRARQADHAAQRHGRLPPRRSTRS